MKIKYEKYHLPVHSISKKWQVLNPFLESVNSEPLAYCICSTNGHSEINDAVFYLHGLGGTPNDCPEIDPIICEHTTLIRLACFGISNHFKAIGYATFGDICAFLYNSCRSIYSIADILGLDTYNIVAHSWGGFIASLAALNDRRCRKAMLLSSTPDICDALSNMYELVRLPGLLRPLADVFMGKLRIEAEKAKVGHSRYQLAWEAISPYGSVSNPGLDMLIFNRQEDLVMRGQYVEHFINYARRQGIEKVRAKFITCSELRDWHDMPPWKFIEDMNEFFYG